MGSRLLVLAVTLLVELPWQTVSQSAQEDARAWFLGIRQEAYSTIMPLAAPDMVVAYRAFDDMHVGVLERYFIIQYVRAGAGFNADLLQATVVRPTGQSFENQLIGLRLKNGALSPAEAVAALTVRRETVYVQECPAVREQLNRLSTVRLTIPRRDVFTLDAVRHEFSISLPNLAMTATTFGGNEALVQWAMRTHQLLSDCVGHGEPSISAGTLRPIVARRLRSPEEQ